MNGAYVILKCVKVIELEKVLQKIIEDILLSKCLTEPNAVKNITVATKVKRVNFLLKVIPLS